MLKYSLLEPQHQAKPTCRYPSCSVQILELCPAPQWDPLVYPETTHSHFSTVPIDSRIDWKRESDHSHSLHGEQSRAETSPLANAGQRKEPQQLRIVPIEAGFEVDYTVLFVQENFTSPSRIQWKVYRDSHNPAQMIKDIITWYVYKHEKLKWREQKLSP